MSGVAVVTGAAQGIGRRTAEVLVAEGYAVAVLDRQPVERPVDGSVDGPVDGPVDGIALAVTGDVADDADVAAFADRVRATLGRVDVLVNNAGIADIGPAEGIDPARFRRVIDVNLTGAFLLCQAFGRQMLEAGGGSIVNVASVAGLMGIADRAAYNASKHGLVGLTRTLAVEWGGRGVRVNAVCPGWVKTEMDDDAQANALYVDSDITDHVPMGRFAQPDDIAQAIAFLADPARSGFVNGTMLNVDGGWYADGSWQNLRLGARNR